VMGSGDPPCGEIRAIFQGFPGIAAAKAIVLPSGDQ